MTIKQISVFIENVTGRLSDVTKILAENEIHIRALSIADTTDYGILRLIVNDPEKAENVLKENGFTIAISDVIGIAIPDVPGGLNIALQVLNKKQIVIEYLYAFLNPLKETAFVILRVEDNQKAIEALEKSGIYIATNEEVCAL